MTALSGLRLSFAALFLAGASLSGCGSDTTNVTALGVVQAAATGVVRAGSAPRAATPTITRDLLNQIPGPVQLVTIEGPNVWGLIRPAAQNGDVATWASFDGQTVSFRQGVLVATRGIGPDLMSADVPSRTQLAGGTGSHRRSYVSLDGLDRPVRIEFDCTMSVIGPATLTLVDRTYSTRHVQEQCDGETGRITNEYWFDGTVTLRKSRQWANPSLSYLAISLLR